jgi:SOUL heme-binding protein
MLLGILGILLVGAVGFQLSRHMFESPDYQVVTSEGQFEVRQYDARLVAETVAEGPDRSVATSEGFSRLAGYIFGGNEKRDGTKEKISMTTPVEATPLDSGRKGERIAMTTPVEATEREPNRWVITFTMPSDKRMEDMPIPKDDRIKLRMREAENVAALRFRGHVGRSSLDDQKRELLARVERQGYVTAGPVTVAVYDPPHWVLPPFRRNEVVVPVRRR